MQGQGIDPLRFKALEALQELAEHPAQGVIGNDGARANLFGSVALAAMGGSGATAAPPQLLAPLVTASAAPTASAAAPISRDTPPATPPPVPVASKDSQADLQRQLDALDERLAEGNISEETYKKISARIEAKLAQLGEG